MNDSHPENKHCLFSLSPQIFLSLIQVEGIQFHVVSIATFYLYEKEIISVLG